jgi:hypothetical protein
MADLEKGKPDEKTNLKAQDGEKKSEGPCCKPVASLVWLVFFIILLVSSHTAGCLTMSFVVELRKY